MRSFSVISRLNRPGSHSLSPQGRCSRPLIILHGPHSSLFCIEEARTGHRSPDVERASRSSAPAGPDSETSRESPASLAAPSRGQEAPPPTPPAAPGPGPATLVCAIGRSLPGRPFPRALAAPPGAGKGRRNRAPGMAPRPPPLAAQRRPRQERSAALATGWAAASPAFPGRRRRRPPPFRREGRAYRSVPSWVKPELRQPRAMRLQRTSRLLRKRRRRQTWARRPKACASR